MARRKTGSARTRPISKGWKKGAHQQYYKKKKGYLYTPGLKKWSTRKQRNEWGRQLMLMAKMFKGLK